MDQQLAGLEAELGVEDLETILGSSYSHESHQGCSEPSCANDEDDSCSEDACCLDEELEEKLDRFFAGQMQVGLLP